MMKTKLKDMITHIHIELKISIEEKKKKIKPTMLLDNKHLKCI